MEEIEITPDMIEDFMDTEDLNQKQMAEMFGVDPLTIRRWQKGNATPTGTAAMLMRVLMLEKEGASDFMTIARNARAYAGAYALYERLDKVFADVHLTELGLVRSKPKKKKKDKKKA
jgi:transcriptional regulator with XRE-family HTH domain